ncbi:MAG: Xaa-Pro peptidase family protein [Eubacteriales bacterium]|nr:Xaa-Pro peptidase family protein [Eubacteriales bacterium]
MLRFGTTIAEWEQRINVERLREDRLAKAKAQLKEKGLGAVLCYDFDNIRYITGTIAGEWARNKMTRYCILPVNGDPYIFDPAAPTKRRDCPWISDHVRPALGSMRGAIPLEVNNIQKVALEVKNLLDEYGVLKMPLGVDIADIPLVKELERQGIEVVDGQQALLDARLIKTEDEVKLLEVAASLADCAFDELVRNIKPGVRESDLTAIAHNFLYRNGSDLVECINIASGPRALPHPHHPADRMIRPNEIVYIDIMHSFMGYRTCYYRTFSCGLPSLAQEKAFERAHKWLFDAMAKIKDGATTADVAGEWPKAQESGYKDEREAFLCQFAHGIGMSIWEKPAISRLFSLDNPFTLRENMVFAIETYCPSEDGNGGVRIEEEVVVKKDGCEIITKYPIDHLISCGLAGCEVLV